MPANAAGQMILPTQKEDHPVSFVQLTRPDNSPVLVSKEEIVSIAPAPKTGGNAGATTAESRILFRNGTHQDVTETIEVVGAILGA